MDSTVYPFVITKVDEETEKELKKVNVHSSAVFIYPKKYIYRSRKILESELKNIYHVEPRPSDVIVMTIPRSGTTMTQEMVWLINNNLDYETANSTLLPERYVLEYMIENGLTEDNHRIQNNANINSKPSTKDALNIIKYKKMAFQERLRLTEGSRRFIKSHLPPSLIAPHTLDTAKVVYVARDPRDVAVSLYHHKTLIRMLQPDTDFKDFWNSFVKDLTYEAGPYFEHVKEAWQLRHHPNMLFLFYEDLVLNMPVEIEKVSKFFGKSYTKSQIEGLCKHLAFENFRNNPNVNYQAVIDEMSPIGEDRQPFIRKGIVGGWRKYFDDQMTEEAENWIRENLRGTDLKYPEYFGLQTNIIYEEGGC